MWKDCSWGNAFSTMAWELVAWHVPCWKLPQVPVGVPKLANLMLEIDCPGTHCRWTWAWWSVFDSSWLSISKFSAFGWCSCKSAQTPATDLFTRVKFDGSPPSSSNTTTRFFVGFNQDRGTWYLKKIIKIMFDDHKGFHLAAILEVLVAYKGIPSLSWLATAKLTLRWPECPNVAAQTAVTIGISHPVSAYALAVDPYLTLAHAPHVQSQRLISSRCIKISLHNPS